MDEPPTTTFPPPPHPSPPSGPPLRAPPGGLAPTPTMGLVTPLTAVTVSGFTDSQRSGLLATTIILLVLTWVTTFLRLYARAGCLRTFQGDDAAMLTAQLFFTTFCGLTFVLAGQSNESVVQSILYNELVMRLIQGAFVLTTTAIKVGVGLFLMNHIFPTLRIKRFTTLFFMLLSAFAGLFAIFITALHGNMNPTSAKYSNQIFMITAAGWSVLNPTMNLAFFTMSLYAAAVVKAERAAKLHVALVLLLAAIGASASFIRLGVSEVLSVSGTLDVFGVEIWSVIECGACIIAASLVTLRPIFEAHSRRRVEMDQLVTETTDEKDEKAFTMADKDLEITQKDPVMASRGPRKQSVADWEMSLKSIGNMTVIDEPEGTCPIDWNPTWQTHDLV